VLLSLLRFRRIKLLYTAAYLDVPGRRKRELNLDQLELCRVSIPVVLQDRALERGHGDASTPHPEFGYLHDS